MLFVFLNHRIFAKLFHKNFQLIGTGIAIFFVFLVVIKVVTGLIFQSIAPAGNTDIFVHRYGNGLAVGQSDEKVTLRGIIMNTSFELEDDIFPLKNMYNADDYKKIADMGMNVVRLTMHYKFFEDDVAPYKYKDSAWDWLDSHIGYARENKLYLILDMREAQGKRLDAEGNEPELFADEEMQKRFRALWQAIAQRYAGEPVIVAYDLLNEPAVGKDHRDAWKVLADKTARQIRKVDPNHLIIVQKLAAVIGDHVASNDPAITQFLISDPNVMYDFHFYKPEEFAFQIKGSRDNGGVYPGGLEFPADLEYVGITDKNPTLKGFTQDWRFYDGEIKTITDSAVISAYPQFRCENTKGTAYFDAFVIKEYDKDRVFIRDIVNMNIDSAEGWNHVSERSGVFELSGFGNNDGASLTIGKISLPGAWNNVFLRVPIRTGYAYQISGFMRGSNITESFNGCRMVLVFEKSAGDAKVQKRDREYLETQLRSLAEFGKKENVPMSVSEYGATRDAFSQDRGGLVYMTDILDLFDAWGLHASYASYEKLFFDDSGNQSPNTALIEFFENRLKK
ncbi:MAG: cellulase family glycosylhydrolase [Parcubacteria group bacterium]|nr:cellulase family glycosylhydrolase [Parcubacteria group bacterium]